MKPKTKLKLKLETAVDKYGAIAAEIADLEDKKKALRAHILSFEVEEAEGDLWRVTCVTTTRHTLDKDAVVKKLGLKWVLDNTKDAEVTTVKAVARTGLKVAAE